VDRYAQEEKVVIYPKKGRGEPDLGADALMVMVSSEMESLIELTQAREVGVNGMPLSRLYQTRGGKLRPLAISGPFLGAPHAVMGMEKLIALGVSRIWVLGWCGSLQPGLEVGQVVIPLSALSEEGTSRHYPLDKGDFLSDPVLAQLLEDTLKRACLPFSKGRIWSTDAIYRETLDKVRRYQSLGILAVEMEISALMAVALYRSVAMSGLLVVSDELFDLRWRPGFRNPLLRERTHAAAKILLDVAGMVAEGGQHRVSERGNHR